MVAKTDLKARLLDLTTGMLELTRDGERDIGEVCELLQIVKEDRAFAVRLLGKATLDLSIENAIRFLREFCSIKEVDLSTFKKPQVEQGNLWTVPCSKELTYERLVALIEEWQIPHHELTLHQDRKSTRLNSSHRL